MIGWLLPAGLVALLALGLPVAIHLLRRPEPREQPFAAWRYLSAPNRPREQRRLREWPLLLLRLLLLAVLALLLARPVWRAARESADTVVLVAPDVPVELARAQLGARAAQARWLQPGWPALDHPPAAHTDWALLRQLDADLAEGVAVDVLLPAVVDEAPAERLRLSREVGWRAVAVPASVPADSGHEAGTGPARIRLRYRGDVGRERATVDALVAAWRASGLEITLDAADLQADASSGASPGASPGVSPGSGPDAGTTAVQATASGTPARVAGATVPATATAAVPAGLSASAADAVPVAGSAPAAFDRAASTAVGPADGLPGDTVLAIVLGGAPDAETQRWVTRGGTLLLTQAPDGGWPPVERAQGRGRVFALDTPLDPQVQPALRDPAIAADWRRRLLRPAGGGEHALAESLRPVVAPLALTPPARGLDSLLMGLAVLLLLAERALAFWRLGRRT